MTLKAYDNALQVLDMQALDSVESQVAIKTVMRYSMILRSLACSTLLPGYITAIQHIYFQIH
jgi:hypothetical protein